MNNVDRAVFEIRLFATAILTNRQDIRDKIFNSDCFLSDTGKSFYKKLKAVYNTAPNTDYFNYLNALPKDERALLAEVLQSTLSPTVEEAKVDDTLKQLKQAALEEELKNGLMDLLTSEFNRSEALSLFEKTEYTNDTPVNSLEKYLADFNEPLELIPTGFPILDRLLNGGLIKGTLTSIGARPSVGKTTFSINIAAHNPKLKILFFSLEMSSRMIYDRLLADIAGIDYADTGKHNVNFDTVKTMLKKYSLLTIIDDVSEIERISEIIYDTQPELVIIDYIQIVQSKKNFVDNRQRVDYISQTLKKTAKKTKACIAGLSQLTRGAAEKPTMSALKESGGLEQDSDYIILLHRPFVNNKSDSEIRPCDTTVILDKNKFGDTGELKYDFNGRFQRFTEIGKSDGTPIARMKNIDEEEVTEDDDLPF